MLSAADVPAKATPERAPVVATIDAANVARMDRVGKWKIWVDAAEARLELLERLGVFIFGSPLREHNILHGREISSSVLSRRFFSL